MQDVSLTKASVADLPMIASIARKVWNEHYPSVITQAQIDYMLDLMYSPESLKEQMTIKDHRFFFVLQKGDKTGFISIYHEGHGNWFLNKFYIDQSRSRKGAGTQALALLISEIRPSGITLTVNRQNYKAINFYFKNGFKIERVADFDIGNGYVMNDFVMRWDQNANTGR